mgnify:CR=1 FL=1
MCYTNCMIQVIENAVNTSLQEYVKSQICEIDFPWYYTNDIVRDDTNKKFPGFMSPILQREYPPMPKMDLFLCVLFEALEKTEVKFDNIDRIRAGMFTKEHSNIIHNSHIDYEISHTAMIYYVIDSDGPTYFYDNNNNIIKQVEPKQGTAVIFDGHTLHSSSSPVTSDRRIVVNYNFNLPHDMKWSF